MGTNGISRIAFLLLTLCSAIIICAAANYHNSFPINQNVQDGLIKKALIDCGKADWYPGEYGSAKLSIAYGKFTGENDEAVYIINLPGKRSLALLYKIIDGTHTYSTIIDTFSNITDSQIIERSIDKRSSSDILIIRETIGNMLGTFETGTYLRAYCYNKDLAQFCLVLSINESYKAYWNELWGVDRDNKSDGLRWLKIEEKSGIKWTLGKTIRADVVRRQNFSACAAGVDMPGDGEFDVTASRDVAETYVWSDEWNHFILFEGIFTETGEDAAIIEDFSSSPFELSNPGITRLYRIKKANNKIETVSAEQLEIYVP